MQILQMHEFCKDFLQSEATLSSKENVLLKRNSD